MTKEDLGKYFERNDEIFHAIAYIDTPALELESISTGKRDVVVIDSQLSKEYKKIGEQEDRIQKAIEYIWSTKYEWGDLEEDNEDFDIDVYKLLDILKGDNNE